MLLEKGINNVNIDLTLLEKTTISDPFYLFEFQNDLTGFKYYQVFTDISIPGVKRDRTNLFNIEVLDSGTAGPNQIVLGNVGLYNYIIYQQTSPTNIDPVNTSGVVERDLMRLVDDEVGIYIQHEVEVTYVAREQ